MNEIMVDKRDILGKPEGYPVSGLVFLQAYNVMPTKNGGEYIAGTIQAKGQISFKAWNSSNAFKVLRADTLENLGKIYDISGSVNVYNGQTSLIIDTMQEVECDLKAADFYEDVYDAESYWNSLVAILKKRVSENAFKVFELVVSGDVKERFMLEYAAAGHHDNCKSGLLAHTTKVSKIASVLSLYPEILKRVGVDLLYIGCALHDIGKICEYNSGCVTKEGEVISHNISGVLMIYDHLDEIEELMGNDFASGLISIISQHHGEYGDPPRTVVAYVIHLIDMIESTFTSINTLLADADADQKIIYQGFKLS